MIYAEAYTFLSFSIIIYESSLPFHFRLYSILAIRYDMRQEHIETTPVKINSRLTVVISGWDRSE